MRRVVVTGIGTINPLGNSVETSWNSLINSKSGISKITKFDVNNYPCKIAGSVEDSLINDEIVSSRERRKIDRFITLGLIAANEAINDSGFILDDESWSLKANVFDRKSIFNPKSPWISNTAVAQLLFKNDKNFQKYFPQYRIVKNKLSEFFIFLNSGGVNSSFFYIKLNSFFLKLLNIVDKILIFFLPSIFALNRTVVLKKINEIKK